MTWLIVDDLDSTLRGRLEKEAHNLEDSGVCIKLETEEIEHEVRFRWRLEPCDGDPGTVDDLGDNSQEASRLALARAITDTILHDVEPAFLRRKLEKLKPEYGPEDVGHVVSLALYEVGCIAAQASSERYAVFAHVLQYLTEERVLHLPGFARFRLKEYRAELDDCLERAIKDFEAEQEHQEFVTLLRHFLDGQAPKVKTVHVLPDGRASFRLVDGEGVSLENYHLDGFILDLAVDEEIDREDLLISALVTLAPVRVCCHLPRDSWNLAEVEEVFFGRFTLCPGCRMCEPKEASIGKPRLR